MTATNHALTGAIIGLTISNPAIAIPAAFLSHFVCDALPHFGANEGEKWLAKRAFVTYLIADATLCIMLVGVMFGSGNPNWFLASVCAFLATSPDLLWIRKFVTALKATEFRPSRLEVFLSKDGIQWFQRPIGWTVEAAWAVACVIILAGIL